MIIYCSECGKEVSDKAVACPNCGAPIAKVELQDSSKPQQTVAMQDANNANTAPTAKRPASVLVMAIIALLIGLLFSMSQISTDNPTSTDTQLIFEAVFVAAVGMMAKAQIPAVISAIIALVSYALYNRIFAIVGLIVAICSLLAVLYLGFSYSSIGLLVVMPLYLPAPILAIIANAIAVKRFSSKNQQTKN